MNAHAKLSAREAEVVKLLSEGQAPKEIAFALGISIKTVDFHSGRARQKIGHPSIAILTRYAILSGLSPLRQLSPP